MDIGSVLSLLQTALELGLISSLVVLALFLSYSMLNVCDLSTDGCFTLGAAVGATVAISGHPYLAIPAAMGAGVLSGFVTAFLQTKMGIDSLLAGIIVNTGLYSVNIAVMGNSSLLNMNRTETVFTKVKAALDGTPFAGSTKLIVSAAAVTDCGTRYGQISYVATLPEYEGQGYGRAVVYHCAGWLQEKNLIPLVACETHRESFYAGLGFQKISEVTVFTG